MIGYTYQRTVSRTKAEPPVTDPMAKDPEILAITTQTSPAIPKPSGKVAPMTKALPTRYMSWVSSPA
jgi:hypothetical protein